MIQITDKEPKDLSIRHEFFLVREPINEKLDGQQHTCLLTVCSANATKAAAGIAKSFSLSFSVTKPDGSNARISFWLTDEEINGFLGADRLSDKFKEFVRDIIALDAYSRKSD